ncbi:hypothetical protein [Paenibacillus sp. 1001270B_150601_E10]|uniref:hypothetical protein n=1 Tax=Paenibacillus sp. 1001270B_150601_E10 TaxID=2787079 RepID=UPI00189EA546|nr:hypothetical protein [Paenibacillus sp. 1001270B_150601_E10]
MDTQVKRYYHLKQKKKELEAELQELHEQIMSYCQEQQTSDIEIGSYRVKLVLQERKEYDDTKLYEALPDPEVWRLCSKTDPSKLAGLVKLNVIPEEKLKDTYTLKPVTLLKVEKK